MIKNYSVWGGKYYPIIPVENNTIEPSYVSIMEVVDPDIIYYTKNINIHSIKQLNVKVYPHSYIEFDENRPPQLYGINVYSLLQSYFGNSSFYRQKVNLVQFEHSVSNKLSTFYEVNFGIGNPYPEEAAYMEGFKVKNLDNETILDANTLLTSETNYFRSVLSGYLASTSYLNAEKDFEANLFELIVYDEANGFDDLLYFWNRQLYQEPGQSLKQIIVSKSELISLSDNKSFGTLLNNLAFGKTIYIVSKSIKQSELKQLVDNLTQKITFLNVKIISPIAFPYSVRQILNSRYEQEQFDRNLLFDKNAYLPITMPHFLNNLTESGYFSFDLTFIKEEVQSSNNILFPYYTLVHSLVAKEKGRVNRKHILSFKLDQSKKGLEVTLPSELEIFKSRIHILQKDDDLIYTSVQHSEISSAGMKLSSFFKLFNYEWLDISNYIQDKFWLNLLKGKSDYKDIELKIKRTVEETLYDKPYQESDFVVNQNKEGIIESKFYKNNLSGDGIFSYLDIQSLLFCVYYAYRDKIELNIKEQLPNFSIDFKFISDAIVEDLNRIIKPSLQYLVSINALFIGIKIKCNNCGSNLWYSIDELSRKMTCKGCRDTVMPKIESPYYYKVNDVILNNLMNDQKNLKKDFHGNYVVIKTLLYIKENHESNKNSFLYSPCFDIVIHDQEAPFKKTDIDILAIKDGKLIAGEAKVSARDFNTKVINQLIWVGKNIMPDKLILAYQNGHFDKDKLERIKAEIDNPNIEIIDYRISEPWYHFGRIFGFPK